MSEMPASGPGAASARAAGKRARTRRGQRWTGGEPAQQPSEPDWQPGTPRKPERKRGAPDRQTGPQWSEDRTPCPEAGQWRSGQPERARPPDAEHFLHPVLAGYDGSEPSCHALAYAAGMARRLDRDLVVLYCTQTRLPPVGGFPFLPLTAAACLPGRAAGDEMAWLKAELTEAANLGGLRVRIIERDGDPARELACAAAQYNTDAIVIGAPRRFVHRFAGSVPSWLARHARCPVVIVP